MVTIKYCKLNKCNCKFSSYVPGEDKCSYFNDKECKFCVPKKIINVSLDFELPVNLSATDDEIENLIKKKIKNGELLSQPIVDYTWDDNWDKLF